MTELQTRFRQYFSTPLRRRPFDDDYEPCMKHMQRGWIKQVQYEDLNMRQANMLFKSARNSPKLKDHSHEFVSRLQPHHSLVKYPHFEQGVVKIMSGNSESMTPEEQEWCEPLLKEKWAHLYDQEEEEALDIDMADSPSKFAKMMAAGSKRAHDETGMRTKYVDCSFLSPCTVILLIAFLVVWKSNDCGSPEHDAKTF